MLIILSFLLDFDLLVSAWVVFEKNLCWGEKNGCNWAEHREYIAEIKSRMRPGWEERGVGRDECTINFGSSKHSTRRHIRSFFFFSFGKAAIYRFDFPARSAWSFGIISRHTNHRISFESLCPFRSIACVRYCFVILSIYRMRTALLSSFLVLYALLS